MGVTAPTIVPILAGDGALVLRVEVPRVDAPDELGTIEHFAKLWGVEPKGLKRRCAEAAVPMLKVGRQWVARRSAVLSIVEKLAAKKQGPSEPIDSYAEIVERARRSSR